MIHSCFDRSQIEPNVCAPTYTLELDGPGVSARREAERVTSDGAKKIQVLVTDDDADLLYVTRLTLESFGFVATTCNDPSQALDCIREGYTFDLLLTDLQMPQMTGLELAQSVTAIQPSMPVLVMSGSVLSRETQMTIARKGWRFLPKPFLIPELIGHIQGMIRSEQTSTAT